MLIGMGSNIDPAANLRRAAADLRRVFPDVRFSHVYRSPPMGMEGGDFLNACALFSTRLSRDALKACLRRIERRHGRIRRGWVPRTLDLDILIYKGEVDHEALSMPFFRLPASELVPEWVEGLAASEVQRFDLRL